MPVTALVVALCAAAGCATAGCGRDRRPDPSAAVMPQPPPARAPVRRLRVVALADEDWQRVARFEARIRGVVGAASAFTQGQFGLALELERVGPWPTSEGEAPAEGDLLARLEAAAPMPAADLVIGFTARPPPRRPTMALLAPSRYAGRHVVLYGQGRYHGTPAHLRAGEVRALLAAIGRIYGALPACNGITSPRPPAVIEQRDNWRWGSTNLALIEAHRSMDLRDRSGPSRVPTPVAEQARRILMEPGRDLRCALEEVDGRRHLLAEVMAAASRAERAAESGDTLMEDPAEERAASAIAAAEARMQADPAGAFEACRPIADARPALGARCAGRASEALGLHDDAVRYYRAWLAHHPGDEDVVLSLAREVGRDGDDEAARALLSRAVEAHPDFVQARLNLGIALARLGRYPEARAAWQALLERAPDHAEARRLLDALNEKVPPSSR